MCVFLATYFMFIENCVCFSKGQIILFPVTATTEFKSFFLHLYLYRVCVCIKSEFEHLNKDKFGKFIRWKLHLNDRITPKIQVNLSTEMNTENLHFFLQQLTKCLTKCLWRIELKVTSCHQVLTAHHLFKLDPMTMTKGETLHNLNLICWKTSNFYKLAVNK